jgi:hypothetical protein
MKLITKVFILSFTVCQVTLSQNIVTKWEPIAMINDVTFRNSKIWNHNAACGFLVKYKNDTLAITAKHILTLFYSDSLQTASFQGRLKQWAMYPKDKKEQKVIIDRLLNEDKRDSIGMGYINKNWDNFNDWLIFKIKENNSNVKPLKIRKTELKKGEKVFVIGWTYLDFQGEQRIYEYEYHNSQGTHLLLKKLKAPQFDYGLSGSPVIDIHGRLVGILSGNNEDPTTKEKFTSACRVDYLKQFLRNLPPKNY